MFFDVIIDNFDTAVPGSGEPSLYNGKYSCGIELQGVNFVELQLSVACSV